MKKRDSSNLPASVEGDSSIDDDDDTSYNCELCRDSGRIELTDGHYQYIGDGTASCPRCYGGILRT